MNTPNNRAPEVSKGQRVLQIRTLNDAFRATFIGGRVLLTPGVQALGEAALQRLVRAIQGYDAFSPDNDPYGEHDFGSIACDGAKIFWKIDYYDKTMTRGSEDPANSGETLRVLTIMLAEEY